MEAQHRTVKGRSVLQPHKLQIETLLREKAVNHRRVITTAEKQNLTSAKHHRKTQNILCCPDILNVHVNIYPAVCNNKGCKKKVSPNPGSKTLQCHACNKSMLLKNCYIEVNASFQLQKDNKQTSVTAFAKTLSSFLDEDVYQYKDNEEALTEKLLLLDYVDFYLSATGRLITSKTKHTASDDTFKSQQDNNSQDNDSQ